MAQEFTPGSVSVAGATVTGIFGQVEVVDPLGANDPAQERKVLEAILMELKLLNVNIAGLVNNPVMTIESVSVDS